MSLAQQVGQLFMVGTTAYAVQGVSANAISSLHVGNIFLSGRSHLGIAGTAGVVASLRALVSSQSTDRQPLLVATDQEGGEVQVLQGPGFDAMPTGLAQSSLSAATEQALAARWGAQLASAGVNMNLAPVADLLTSPAFAPSNPPIGVFQRELGFDPQQIESHASAFRAGMANSGVLTVLKHFPGLGHVTLNTDTSRGVVDSTVTATGPDVAIYRTEIADGAPCIMVSSANYAKLDGGSPASFSSTVVTGLLRRSLGFRGLVMTDDVSLAMQVRSIPPGTRAIDAINAGVDIVLISAYPADTTVMVDAVLAKAESDPAFAARVAAAARLVVELKHKYLAAEYPNGSLDPVTSNRTSPRPFS